VKGRQQCTENGEVGRGRKLLVGSEINVAACKTGDVNGSYRHCDDNATTGEAEN
jgi:hypothetical protein